MKKIIIGAVVALVLVLAGWWFYPKNTVTPVVQNNTVAEDIKVEKVEIVAAPKTHEVIYTDSGYAPATLAIKVGDTVVFKNQSSSGMWTASAMHPSHTVYGGTSLQQHCPDASNTTFDECVAAKTGESWAFTFNKTGTWGYHNHVNASKFGKIVVE